MRKIRNALAGVLCLLFPLQQMSLVAAGRDDAAKPHPKTESPIKHVIVIIGENRTFDHSFGLYQPPSGQAASNLLSKGILNPDGTPGPNFSLAAQYQATDTTTFSISPARTGPYSVLPQPNTDGTPSANSDTSAPFLTLAEAKPFEFEGGLPNSYYPFLTTGASGLPNDIPDPRFPSDQPNGPFQLTLTVPYDDYGPSAVHRFYQMWQQLDCNIAYATPSNPSGCNADLFPWVEDTIGAGNNGAPQPAGFNDETTGEGDNAMGVYNNNVGDWPYFTALAKTYTMSDNFHQSVMGGTGANHIMLGTGDAMWFSDGNGNPIVPPSNEIENPNPQPGTNNWYTQDGYSGGSLSDCADQAQPGVGPVFSFLNSLPYKVWNGGNCDANHYYLLNNYNPGYFGDGRVNTSAFTLPPSNVRTIGDELLEANISWKYYGEDWDLYVQDPNYSNPENNYCNICDPFQYVTSIMTNAAVRKAHLQDLGDFYNDVSNKTLPAVSIIKPDGFLDGHPASSKGDLFEGLSPA